MRKHEGMKHMKRFRPSTENICFVRTGLYKTNILGAENRDFASYLFITFMTWMGTRHVKAKT